MRVPLKVIIAALHLAFLGILWKEEYFTQSSPGGFDFYVLAMTYQPQFCSTGKCKSYPGPKAEFSLHGLWPERYNGTWPSFCSKDALGESAIRHVGMERMQESWPNLLEQSKYTSLWEHEWSKHGTCSGLSQNDYLTVALDYALNGMPFTLQNFIGRLMSKVDLIQAFGGSSNVVTICQSSTSLVEIRVCLAADRWGYPTNRISCPAAILSQDTCHGEYIFLTYGPRRE
jgi:ribonuclease T2